MQIISKSGKVYCQTEVTYPPEIIKSMQRAGYRVKEGKKPKKPGGKHDTV